MIGFDSYVLSGRNSKELASLGRGEAGWAKGQGRRGFSGSIESVSLRLGGGEAASIQYVGWPVQGSGWIVGGWSETRGWDGLLNWWGRAQGFRGEAGSGLDGSFVCASDCAHGG